MTALIRYEAARRAFAAAHRVDEVEAIRDKAEALFEHERDSTIARLPRKLDWQHRAVNPPYPINIEVPPIPDQRTPADAGDHF